jgi:hypothetical protein
MTTTVTSNLNLAKPDIGSEANNWGNVLNGTIDQIDKAIAQRLVKGVGGGSNVILSDSESSFAIIEFQGTLSGNIDVKTASNDTKPYIIFNNTSGSYTLTFKSNSGTGVVITQGLKSIVYGDGSNIVEATSPANSFSANKTITLSGVVSGSVATDFSSDPTITTSIVDGSIVNADINTSAAIDASKIADGSVSNTEFQRLDGVTSDIQSQLNAKVDVASGGGISLSDSDVLSLGTGNEFTIKHDGANSYLDGGNVGTLYIRGGTSGQGSLYLTDSSGGNRFLVGNDGGSTELHYNGTNAKKLETTTSGVSITGNITATGSINASASGLTGALPAIDGSALTGVEAVPSANTDIGSIMPFLIQLRSDGYANNVNPVSVSVGTTFTPSTLVLNSGPYTGSGAGQSNHIIADYTGQFTSEQNRVSRSTSLENTSTVSTKTGTWRAITSGQTGTNTSGNGENSVTTQWSLMFIAQRIS